VIQKHDRAHEWASGPLHRTCGPPLRASARQAARLRAPVALALVATLVACGLEPQQPVLKFSVSPETQLTFEDEGLDPTEAAVAAGQVEGALQLLFGSPLRPGYLVLDAWQASERDPNFGQDELDEDALAAVARDNEVRFARQLEAVRKGEHDEVPRPWDAKATWARWKWAFSPLIEGRVEATSLHSESPAPGDSDEPSFTWGDEAERFWRERYPSLAESGALYQRHCVHCHGATGAGDGPSGVTLDPVPRDFRRGIFKWVAVEAGHRPRRADLARVLERGVEGTSMPAFKRLTRAEREGLVDWVRLLAVRGETELLVTALAAQRGSVTPELATQAYARAWERWDEAEDKYAPVGQPPDPDTFTAVQVARGKVLFSGEVAKCNTCHGDDGRGDGAAIWELDADGVRSRRLDQWGAPSRPRDLTHGVFRGGDRPADLYRRIKYGIGGTIMPASDPGLSDEDVFALVAFVLSLRNAPAVEESVR
jgi:mono/diheme cytochrome c family protein